jgi:hypothetical protein
VLTARGQLMKMENELSIIQEGYNRPESNLQDYIKNVPKDEKGKASAGGLFFSNQAEKIRIAEDAKKLIDSIRDSIRNLYNNISADENGNVKGNKLSVEDHAKYVKQMNELINRNKNARGVELFHGKGNLEPLLLKIQIAIEKLNPSSGPKEKLEKKGEEKFNKDKGRDNRP